MSDDYDVNYEDRTSVDNEVAEKYQHMPAVKVFSDRGMIGISPGQTVYLQANGPTDEGWFFSSEKITHHGEVIEVEFHRDGADCDGRMSSGGERWADPNNVDARGVVTGWDKKNTFQRDYAAEAAGY